MSNKVDIYIANATPHSFHLGTNEISGRVQSLGEVPRPMHLPFCLFYAQKGTADEVMVDGAAFTSIFGDETLNEQSPYFNHSSAFIKGILNDGGIILAKRIIPEGAETPASLRLSLEYLETTYNEYERDAEGNFIRQAGGFATTGRQINGIMYRYVVENVPVVETDIGGVIYKSSEFGLGAESVGDLTDGLGNSSKRVPLFDFSVASAGRHGNLSGVSIWSPRSVDQSPINLIAMNDTGSYPFRLSLHTKATPTSSAYIHTTTIGAREVDFTLKPASISKAGVPYYIGETFVDQYNDLTPSNPLVPPTYGPFSRIHVYQNNIDAALELFMTKELDVEDYGDFAGFGEEDIPTKKYLFDLFGGKHSKGSPYQSFRPGDLGENGTILDQNVILWARGGSDGEMSDEGFANAVEVWLEEMADPNGKYMDDVAYNDSVFYDTGLPFELKLKLGKYISTRKDRWVCVSTHVAGEEGLIPPAEENARLAAIRSALRLHPDSTLFGTSTYRALILKGSGRLDKTVSSYRKRLPISYEIARMLTKYWGAPTGRANPRYDYTEGDNNYFRYMVDVSNSWTPYQVRNQAWAAGGMWSQRSERKRDFFPMYRTIFDDDSSTLTTLRTMLVHVEVNKIGYEGHRRFSGKDWPENRFLDEVQEFYFGATGDYKFGGKVEVDWSVTLTNLDKERGWSWHTESLIYADNQRTVQVFNSTNQRRSDKPANSNAIIA